MRKSLFKNSLLFLLALSTCVPSLAQEDTQSHPPRFPIAYGSTNDGLPRSLTLRGTISQVDYAPPACGELIFAATFEIKLDRKPRGYNHPFVYVVVPCLYRPEGEEKFLNRHIEIRVTKQEKERRPCFYDRGTNEIDSKGVPFYCAKREELLQAIANNSSSAHEEPAEFEGSLEKGNIYRALVMRDRDGEWRTVVGLRFPYHHAARIEWLNSRDFPQLNDAKKYDSRLRIVFEVVDREIAKIRAHNRWNTTYQCRIASVE